MNSLFEDSFVNLNLPDAKFLYFAKFIENPDELFDDLQKSIEWSQKYITMYGKEINLPRLTAWYGDVAYYYSGILNVPKSMPPQLQEVKNKIEQATGCLFNSVLLNLYRDEKDSVSYHQDNEKGMGSNPNVASVSLGAERVFRLKHLTSHQTTDLVLENGSLLLMGAGSQTNYAHALPKAGKAVGVRINLTFRNVIL